MPSFVAFVRGGAWIGTQKKRVLSDAARKLWLYTCP